MAYNAWTAPIGGPMVDDAAINLTNTVTLTAISPGAAANPIWYPGNTIKAGAIVELEAWGTVSTSGTTPTLIIGFYWGGTAGVILAATTAITLTNQAGAAWPWRMHYKGRVTQCGTTGSINGIGEFENPTSLVAFTGRRIPETIALQTVAIDTTINKAVVVGATWGAAASTNIINCNGFLAGVWG
jgi:hypothetical protein